MALKTRLSDFSREKLVQNIGEAWFQELLEVMRNNSATCIKPYDAARPLTQMEHQALSGSYREGALAIVQLVPLLAEPPKEKTEAPAPPFGELKQLAPDPKSLSQAPKAYTQPK